MSNPRKPPPVFYKLNPGEATVCQQRKQIAQRERILGDLQRSTLSCCKKAPKLKIKRNVFHLQGDCRKLVENTKLFCQCTINHTVLYVFIFTECVRTSYPRRAKQPPMSYLTVSCFNRQHFTGLIFWLKI